MRLLQRMGMLLVLLSGVLAGPAAHPAAATPPWGDKSSPFGMVVSLGNRVRSDEMPAMIALMREAGVQWNREELSWDQIQQAPAGPMDWDGTSDGFYNYDRSIQLQADAGISILGLLDYNPAWFKSKNPPLEDWLDAWGDYVYATVARYGRERDQIHYWELWNEPNLLASGYESGLYTPEHYVRVLQVGYAAAKAADPRAQIVLGGIAEIWSDIPDHADDLREYLEQLHALGAWDYFDILGLHPYRPTAPEFPTLRRDHLETLRNQMDLVDLLLARFGNKPVWYTEVGWTSQADDAVSELDQAAWLQRFYLIALTHPGVEKIFWYDFRNDTGGNQHYTRPIYDPNEEQFHFGLLRRTFPLRISDERLRKPAFSAFWLLTRSLNGLTWSGQENDALDTDGLGWQRWSSGQRTVDVLWWTLPDGTPPYVTLRCDCAHALVRSYDGQVARLLRVSDGLLQIAPPADGSPVWLEWGDVPATGDYRFAETPYSISGAFLNFWERNGGLARFGLPLSNELQVPGPGGIPQTVQFFERNRFELHPENPAPYQVLLGLLGESTLAQTGVNWRSLPPAPNPPPDGCTRFPETSHSLCWPFKAYWEQNGGVGLYGFPITEAFWEYDPATQTGRLVQYFERNRFEHHPDLAGTPYEVQLGLLGQQLYTAWNVWP